VGGGRYGIAGKKENEKKRSASDSSSLTQSLTNWGIITRTKARRGKEQLFHFQIDGDSAGKKRHVE